MDTYPYTTTRHEPTKKQLWLAAYVALLNRVPPQEAVQLADEALKLANERWRDPKWARTWNFIHNYPVGYDFEATLEVAPPSEGG